MSDTRGPALAPGATLDHYKIVQPLGRGGMGEVYVAFDSKLDRKVALKLLPAEVASDPDRRQRFDREAKAVAALSHPNIVTIFSIEESGGRPYLTMELIEGELLAEAIPNGGMTLERFLALSTPMADALSAAHQRGIVHRDLKPTNVMLTTDGRVKVLDFGLAKLMEAALPTGGMTQMPTRDLTGEGRIVGTVAYMSPEQAEGKAVDARSDLFSLGVIFYEMVTGEKPFKGETSMSLLSSIIKDTPRSITDLNAAMPRHLGRIIRKALAKDPEHRYQTAKDLRNDLEELKSESDSGELAAESGASISGVRATAGGVAAGGRRVLSPAFLIVGAAAFAAAISAGYMIARRPAPPGAGGAATQAAAIKMTRLTDSGAAQMAAISPDGRYVVHVVTEQGQQSLWIRQVATTSNVQIVPPGEVRFQGITISRDGNFVYYVAYPLREIYASLFQIPILGGAAKRLIADIDSPPTFSPDGRRFAFMRGAPDKNQSYLMLANADGTGETILASRSLFEGFINSSIGWSPDGAMIVTAALTGDADLTMAVYQVRVADGKMEPLGGHRWVEASALAWSPDGQEVFMQAFDPAAGAGSQIWGLSFPAGNLRRLTNDLSNYHGVSLTADGATLATVQREVKVALTLVPGGDSSRAREILPERVSRDGFWGFDWTPDGRIVYSAISDASIQLFSTALDSPAPRVLTSKPFQNLPNVSPDGRTIAYSAADDTGERIWSMEIDGSNPKPLSPGPADDRAHFTPDGKTIYYIATTKEGESIKRIPAGGGTPVPAEHGEVEPGLKPAALCDISPDGRWMAVIYLDVAQRSTRVALLSISGNERVQRLGLVPESGSVLFTRDGSALSYIRTERGVSNIWLQPLDGKPARQLTQFTSEMIYHHAWSRDGKSLAVVRGHFIDDVILITNFGR